MPEQIQMYNRAAFPIHPKGKEESGKRTTLSDDFWEEVLFCLISSLKFYPFDKNKNLFINFINGKLFTLFTSNYITKIIFLPPK